MRIISNGIDLIECRRIEQVWRRHPDRFLARILTVNEQAYCLRRKNPVPSIAGRFAAKEAVLKVLGTGWRGAIAWTDMEVTNNAAGQPTLALTGACQDIAAGLGIAQILISVTHTEHYAAASAIGIGS